MIYQPKTHGGLGVKDISLFNNALLSKWKWNLFHQKNCLWWKVLNSKYRGWCNLGVGKLVIIHLYDGEI
uniref:Uncharacterized protein n=1 Tax=Cajanus cajan TaxID=3821 RepID=A0A151RIB4_CAJCA|nr:hypothetical protein KK1_036332 [Cajanus cajan]